MIDFKFFAKSDNIKILQMTDMQIIDGAQCRYDTRLTARGKAECDISHAYRMAYFYMDELVERTKPDLIILTGDLVYGEFDDNGTVFSEFVKQMDKYNIPWAPVFGNHDNESEKGSLWQSRQLENAKNCLFKYRPLEGTSNYNIALYNNDNKLIRMIYMLDSNGCDFASELSLKAGTLKNGIIGPKTREWFISSYLSATENEKNTVPSFACFHIAPIDYNDVMIKKGYMPKDYSLFKPFVADKDNDFGKNGTLDPKIEPPILPDFRKINVDGIFMGHEHLNNAVIDCDGIKWVFGMKTGTYDNRDTNRLGGTLITIDSKGNFNVEHQFQKENFYYDF